MFGPHHFKNLGEIFNLIETREKRQQLIRGGAEMSKLKIVIPTGLKIFGIPVVMDPDTSRKEWGLVAK